MSNSQFSYSIEVWHKSKGNQWYAEMRVFSGNELVIAKHWSHPLARVVMRMAQVSAIAYAEAAGVYTTVQPKQDSPTDINQTELPF